MEAHPGSTTILVIGAGAMGAQIAMAAALAGYATTINDVSGTQLDAADALGVHRVVSLGYPDGKFSTIDIGTAAEALAVILREESADAVTTYDQVGGYGHPDHVHVHRVGAAAARRAGTPVVLEATVDRRLLLRGVRAMRFLPRALRVTAEQFSQSYTPHAEITHRVDVRRQLGRKQAALAAHRSQRVGGSRRTVDFLLGLPSPLTRPVLGREWFVEPGRAATSPPCDDIFASLR